MPRPDDDAPPNVWALREVRVLVAAADERFVRAATFVLSRHNLRVETAPKPAELLADVERRAPDVVVLDATGSVASAARTALAVQGLRPETSVVFVYEDGDPPAGVAPAFPKWVSFEPLVAHIERLHGRPARPRRPAT